nr:DUF4143 domain-containing protein [Mobiluncus mulieris]
MVENGDFDAVMQGSPVRLTGDQFGLSTKVEAEPGTAADVLPSGTFVVLDTEVTEDLEAEGYARDVIRAVQSRSQQAVLVDREARGHLVESAVGARLLAECQVAGLELFWWREGNQEVDFVLRQDEWVVAIEVKSGRQKPGGGLDAFLRNYPQARRLVVGGAGHSAVPLEDFLMDSTVVLQNLGLRL